jgi:hypothetical protein
MTRDHHSRLNARDQRSRDQMILRPNNPTTIRPRDHATKWPTTKRHAAKHSRLDFNTHKSDFYMQSVILTRLNVIMTLTSVTTTRTSVNSTRIRLISTRRVQFPHAECDFYTHSLISTRIVILTCRNVITTLTTVISTRTRVISTRRVGFWHVWVWLCDSCVWFEHLCVWLMCVMITKRMSVTYTRTSWITRTN